MLRPGVTRARAPLPPPLDSQTWTPACPGMPSIPPFPTPTSSPSSAPSRFPPGLLGLRLQSRLSVGDGRSSLKFHLSLGGGAGEVLTRCVSSPGLHPFPPILPAPPPSCDRFPPLIRNDVDRSIVGINGSSLSCPANGHQFGTSGRQIIQPETQAPASPSLPLHPLPFSFFPYSPSLLCLSPLSWCLIFPQPPTRRETVPDRLHYPSTASPAPLPMTHSIFNVSLWVGDPTRSGGAKGKPSA